MKNFLLICTIGAAAFASVPAYGESAVIADMQLKKVSPDGKYAVSDADEGIVSVIDTKTGETLLTVGEGYPYFFLGYGNSISETGIFVGQYGGYEYDGAVYVNIAKGDIERLSGNDDWGGDQAMGITPDGSVICGYVTNMEAEVGKSAFKLPVVWRRGADGSYGAYEALPVPDDWTGRVPYTIEAQWISDDGRTILGRMTDAYSMVNYGEAIGWPILYTMNDASEWEFRLLGGNMINPEHVEFPPYPSEILDEPRAKNFMTEEEYQSYMSAYSEYLEGVADMPQIKDYMTESEYAEYTAAMNEYEANQKQLLAFDAAYKKATEGIPMFYYNMVLSPDGKTASLFDGYLDSGSGMNLGKSYIFDVAEDTYEYVEEPKNLYVTQLFDDGKVLGYAEAGPGVNVAYMRLPGKDSFMTLYDWANTVAPGTSLWMVENMTHTVFVLGQGGFEPAEMIVTGAPYASSNLGVMVTHAINMWETSGSDMFRQMSYVLDLNNASGIEGVQCDGNDIKGNEMKGDVYTIDGRLVVSGASPADMRTLTNGIYIVRSGDVTKKIMVNNH